MDVGIKIYPDDLHVHVDRKKSRPVHKKQVFLLKHWNFHVNKSYFYRFHTTSLWKCKKRGEECELILVKINVLHVVEGPR